MSLADDISRVLSRFLKEPAKPLVVPPSCKNCFYVQGNFCKKRNMNLEYDRAKICPYFTQEQPVTSMPTSLTESDIALLREALGKELTLQILDDINTYGAKESTLQTLKTDVAKELTLQTLKTDVAKESTLQILNDINTYGAKESTLQTLKTDVAKESTLQTVLGKITSVDDKVALQTTLNVLKTDIADMKATMGALSGIKVFFALEHKGGAMDLNEYSSDTEVTESSTTYVLKREFNLSTPTPPSGLTVLKCAIIVAIEGKWGGGGGGGYKVDVDDIELISGALSGSYVWYEGSKEVSAGTHNVKVYIKATTGYPAYLRGTRATCGVGTTSITDVKIAIIETFGEGKFLARIGDKCWKTTGITIYGTIKFDESPIDKVSDSVAVTVGGTEYTKDLMLNSRASGEVEFYARTSLATVPCFGRWCETKMEKYYIP